jgi:hypothetical protein
LYRPRFALPLSVGMVVVSFLNNRAPKIAFNYQKLGVDAQILSWNRNEAPPAFLVE